MERELESKIFSLNDFIDKYDMEENIKNYIDLLKKEYPNAVVTREFYKGNSVLVRATQVNFNSNMRSANLERDELEKEEVRIKEKGINGLGENVYREKSHGKTNERELGIGHNGGNERERGGR